MMIDTLAKFAVAPKFSCTHSETTGTEGHKCKPTLIFILLLLSEGTVLSSYSSPMGKVVCIRGYWRG